MRAYVLIWERICFCVGGFSVLKFWGPKTFLAVGWGALANKIQLQRLKGSLQSALQSPNLEQYIIEAGRFNSHETQKFMCSK